MFEVLMTLFISFSSAQELTKNPLILAVAKGCGDKVYSKEIDENEVNEIMSCYSIAMKNLPKYNSTYLGLAYQTCGAYKNSELRRMKCLYDFKKSLENSKVPAESLKPFNDFLKSCPTQEATMNKCLIDIKSNCKKQSETMITCLEEQAQKFPMKEGLDYKPGLTEEKYITNVQVGCGDFKAIGSTAPTAEEVESQVNCYQMGLLKWEKKTLPTAPKQSLDICSQFKYNIQKAGCVRRIAEETQTKDLKEAVKSKKTAADKLKSINPMLTIVDDCFSPKGKHKTFKDPEKHYATGMECVEREFGKASNFTPEAAASASSGVGNQ